MATHEPPGWSITKRVGLVFGILSAAAALVTILAYFNLKPSEPTSAATTVPTTSTPTPSTPSPRPSDTPTTPARPEVTNQPEPVDFLNVTAEIDSLYKVGPNSVAACPDRAVFCAILHPIVLSEGGQLGYDDGCYLTWTLYRNDITTPHDAKNGLRCDDEIVAGYDMTMPAGEYRLELAVETEAGQQGTGDYEFTAVEVNN